MDSNHLTYFKIENFKRFESFEMSNIGQFNLLVGDNNVGKTRGLEALLVDDEAYEWIVKLYNSLILRKLFPALGYKITDIIALINQEETWHSILTQKNISLSFTTQFIGEESTSSIKIIPKMLSELTPDEFNSIKGQINDNETNTFLEIDRNSSKELVSLNKYYLSQAKKTFNLLANNTGFSSQLVKKYAQNINPYKSVRKQFDSIISHLITNLEETRIHNYLGEDTIGVVLSNENTVYPITRFGDGVVKLSRIIIGILSCGSDKRIMIDEIENGIHFSRLTTFWKEIILLCRNQGIQLFATTHSLECQKYFVEALTELGEEYQKDARNISLVENSSGEVKSVTFDFEGFEFALNIGANTR